MPDGYSFRTVVDSAVTTANGKTETPSVETVNSTDAIRLAAINAFSQYGYNGASVRQIARQAGLSVSALYYHFESKQQILADVINRYMDDLLGVLERAHNPESKHPERVLQRIVRSHVSFHIQRRSEGKVGNREVRSLEPPYRDTVVKKRDREARIFAEVFVTGVDAGVFETKYPHEAARALLEMCVAVLDGYSQDRAHSERSPDDVADAYAKLALNLACTSRDETVR